MTRAATFNRETTETQITGALTIDGRGRYDVRTGIRFFDHMLELFTRHGGFDLTIAATGDLDVDQHHTVEDVGIALGDAVGQALGVALVLAEGSTDSNIPMSMKIPAIMIGAGGSGSDAHALTEWFDTADSWKGTQNAVLLAIALARN